MQPNTHFAHPVLTGAVKSFKALSVRFIAACVFALGLATTAQAALITGDPLPANPLWTPNSTNALNYVGQAPGRLNQAAPHVLLSSVAVGSVTLDFFNPTASSLARFEVRIDGIATGATAHFVVPSDTIHAGPNVSAGTNFTQTYAASSSVDVRLALGGERDWDFDWVRFNVAAAVPEPGTLAILGLGLASLGFVRRRKLAS